MFFFFVVIISFFLYGSDKYENVKVGIQWLPENRYLNINFDEKSFYNYTRQIINDLEECFKDYEIQQDVLVLQTFSVSENPSFKIFARPGLTDKQSTLITDRLKKIGSLKAKIVDFHWLYVVELNNGCPDSTAAFVPEFWFPHEKSKLDFYNADLAAKYHLLKTFAKEITIPLLAHVASNVDEKFKNVRTIGHILSGMDYSRNHNVDTIINMNDDYWRAIAAMAPGDQTVLALKIMLYVFNGQFDIARRYCEIIRFFTKPELISTSLLKELYWRLDFFYDQLAVKIKKGIVLHDNGEYDRSIEIYDKILKDYPNSAWANYELYFSKTLRDSHLSPDFKEEWNKAKQIIYSCDPFYSREAIVSTGKDAYRLFQRMEYDSLFKKEEKFKEDIIKYADITFKSEYYEFAAQVFWLLFSTQMVSDLIKNEYILTHFLYCLNKLGATELFQEFNFDTDKEFKIIDEELKNAFISSKVYNSFKRKE